MRVSPPRRANPGSLPRLARRYQLVATAASFALLFACGVAAAAVIDGPQSASRAADTTTTVTVTTPTTVTVTTTVTKTVTTVETSPQVDVGRTILLGARTKSSGCRLGPQPDRRCSPGAIYSGLTKAVLCSRTFRTSAIRNVPTSEKHDVEQEYGLVPRSYGRSLEIDHIVSLELGGSNDIANLYPEKLNAHPGYKAKDKLENKLHDLVCDGTMTLQSAQQQIAANWIKLYRRVYGVTPTG
jgi:hypothetical protein